MTSRSRTRLRSRSAPRAMVAADRHHGRARAKARTAPARPKQPPVQALAAGVAAIAVGTIVARSPSARLRGRHVAPTPRPGASASVAAVLPTPDARQSVAGICCPRPRADVRIGRLRCHRPGRRAIRARRRSSPEAERHFTASGWIAREAGVKVVDAPGRTARRDHLGSLPRRRRRSPAEPSLRRPALHSFRYDLAAIAATGRRRVARPRHQTDRYRILVESSRVHQRSGTDRPAGVSSSSARSCSTPASTPGSSRAVVQAQAVPARPAAGRVSRRDGLHRTGWALDHRRRGHARLLRRG